MIDAGRVLQPLDAADAAIDRLDEYRVPAELADAIEETQRAVDRALRLLLRADARAPDDLRLTALAPDTSLDRVVAGLRQRGLITMELGGRIHELGKAAERARAGAVRASDADVAREAVQLLRYEVGAASEPVAAVAHEAVVTQPVTAEAHDVPPPDASGRTGPGRWLLVVGGVLLAGVAIAAALLLTRDDPMETGVRAFEAGRLGLAEEQLERAVGDDSSNVTALLYLGRIRRTQGRLQEAATTLAAAARRAPDDAGVQRELGYLFLDADRPQSAVARFRRAQELEPESVASWVGLVRALRAAGDSSADEVLARAPAEAQALLTRASRSPPEP